MLFDFVNFNNFIRSRKVAVELDFYFTIRATENNKPEAKISFAMTAILDISIDSSLIGLMSHPL